MSLATWLQLSLMAAVKQLSREVMLVDEAEDFEPTVVKVASLGRGPHLVLVERTGDHARAKPRRFAWYFVDKIARREARSRPRIVGPGRNQLLHGGGLAARSAG